MNAPSRPIPARLLGAGIAGLTLAALVTGPTTAEAAPVVLFARTADAPAPGPADAAAVAKEVLGDGEVILGAAATLLDLDAHPARLPSSPPVGCAGEAASIADLDALLAAAVDGLDSLEYAGSLRAATEARDLLPCVGDVVPTESLYQLYFTEGLAAFYNDDATSAAAAFRAAAAVDSTRPWNDDYAPEPQGVFLAALQGVLKTPGAPLDVDATLENAHIDGRPASGVLRGLPAGPHLVQTGAAGALRGVVVHVPGGEDVVPLMGPEGLEVRLAGGEAAVAPVLAAAARTNGWAESILVVSRTGWVRFEPSTGAFGDRGGGPAPAESVGRPPIAAGVALIAAGAGVAAGGFAANRTEYTKGLDSTDLDDYRMRYRNHLGGFGVGVAGVVMAGVGVALTVAAATATDDGSATAVRILPFGFAGPSAAVLGLVGSF